MKRFALILVALVLSAVALSALEPYDSAVTRPLMQANMRAYSDLQRAVSAGDFLKAAGALATIADDSLTLLGYEAPRGSQEEWQRLHTAMIAAALTGIKACAAQDLAGVRAAASEIASVENSGHRLFR